jgi:hypothetical protein
MVFLNTDFEWRTSEARRYVKNVERWTLNPL